MKFFLHNFIFFDSFHLTCKCISRSSSLDKSTANGLLSLLNAKDKKICPGTKDKKISGVYSVKNKVILINN